MRVEDRMGQERCRALQCRGHGRRAVEREGRRRPAYHRGEDRDDRIEILGRDGLVERDADRTVRIAEIEPRASAAARTAATSHPSIRRVSK